MACALHDVGGLSDPEERVRHVRALWKLALMIVKRGNRDFSFQGRAQVLLTFPWPRECPIPPAALINTSSAIAYPPSSNSFCKRWSFCYVFS